MLKSFKKYFLTGLAVLLPTVISIYIFVIFFNFVDKLILGKLPFAEYIPGLNNLTLLAKKVPGIGFLTTIILIIFTGILTRNLLGKTLLAYFDRVMSSLPVVKLIYKAVKQIVEALMQDQNKKAFQKVVLLEYPRKGLYALAFVTGDSRGEVQERTEKKMVNIFLPTTPNPTSGFLLLVPEEDLIYLEMSVEDGIKLIISGGVVTPPYKNGKGVDNA